MASIERHNLVPDEKVLSDISCQATVELKLANCHIISNTFDTCTFSIQHDIAPNPNYPKSFVIRLEVARDRLSRVAALQNLGQTQLTDLVPTVLYVGTATTAGARQVEYLVSAYCTGTVPLEDVWNTLDEIHQLELMNSVAHAIGKLQTLNISNTDHRIGGPSLGYFSDVKQLLGGILQTSNQESPACELLDLNGGIVLKSTYDDIGRVELSRSDLHNLQLHTVFCHNDLEPRNILVKKVLLTKGKGERYELVAFIDWEMAGFYPFAYEYGLKDNMLGCSNLSFSWYTLFKERTSHLLPADECHTKFIQALRVIDESKRRQMTRNVGVEYQARWIKMQNIKMSDSRQGWVRKSDATAPKALTDRELLEQVQKDLCHV